MNSLTPATPNAAPENPRVKIYEHYLRQIARARQVAHAKHLVAEAFEKASAIAANAPDSGLRPPVS